MKCEWKDQQASFKRMQKQFAKTGQIEDPGHSAITARQRSKRSRFSIPDDVIVKLSGLPHNMSKKAIKTTVQHYAPLAFIDYQPRKTGRGIAYLRYHAPADATQGMFQSISFFSASCLHYLLCNILQFLVACSCQTNNSSATCH